MKVSIEKQSDGSYIAYNTDGEHCVLIGTGDTVKEAKEDFFNSIKEVSEDYTERGQAVPEELQQEPEFHFDISSLFEFYSMFNVSALGRYLGINPGLMRELSFLLLPKDIKKAAGRRTAAWSEFWLISIMEHFFECIRDRMFLRLGYLADVT